jgi:hypothetical protein
MTGVEQVEVSYKGKWNQTFPGQRAKHGNVKCRASGREHIAGHARI